MDGGITDNLGLRAIYDLMELSGGANQMLKKFNKKPVGHFAVIAVNAATHYSQGIGKTNQVPSIKALLMPSPTFNYIVIMLRLLTYFEKACNAGAKNSLRRKTKLLITL